MTTKRYQSGERKDLNKFGGGNFQQAISHFYIKAGGSDTYRIFDAKGNYDTMYCEQGKEYDGLGVTKILDFAGDTVVASKIGIVFA